MRKKKMRHPHPAAASGKDTRLDLLNAAMSVFSRKGFHATTIKDIAKEASLNVSLVSYYFNGKEGLLKACLEVGGTELLSTAQRILKAPSNRDELRARLTLFLEEYIHNCMKNHGLIRIIHREFDMETPFIRDVFDRVFLKTHETFVHFLNQAKKNHLIREDLDAEIAAASLISGLIHMVRMNSIIKDIKGKNLDHEKYHSYFIEQVTQNFLIGTVIDTATVTATVTNRGVP